MSDASALVADQKEKWNSVSSSFNLTESDSGRNFPQICNQLPCTSVPNLSENCSFIHIVFKLKRNGTLFLCVLHN